MNENPFNIKSIHHNAYATSNIAATIRFWRDLLGFKMVLSYDIGEISQYFFSINQTLFISFFLWPDVKKQPHKKHGEPVSGAFIFDHTAFQVGDIKDLHTIQNKFMENGLPITDIIDHGFLYSIYTFDPNGIPLEFNVSQKHYDVIKHPQLNTGNKEDHIMPDITKWNNIDDSWAEFDTPVIQGEGFGLFKKTDNGEK